MTRKITLLGATGSIGTSTASIVKEHRDKFEISAASAHQNEQQLLDLADDLGIPTLALSGSEPESDRIAYCGSEGLLEMIRDTDADIVVNGIAGAQGLMPSVAALESGKDLALANKETLVMAGQLVRGIADRRGRKIIPVDSEHAALFELSEKITEKEVMTLILTASGGAFRTLPLDRLQEVTWKDALAHPTWDMGVKITIDSASMANKGLEVIEACELFDVPEDKVQVVIHPQSCVHGMVRTREGSFYAQMSIPDMRIPIQNALSYPELINYPFETLTFADLHLDFNDPDALRYPCLELARHAARHGGAYPIVYNAANEVAVEAFIQGNIKFTDIPTVIEGCLDGEWVNLLSSLDQVLEIDLTARARAESIYKRMA